MTAIREKSLAHGVALICGGGGEIGGAIARRFGSEGCCVLVADKREAAAEAVADHIRVAGGQAASTGMDVTREEDCSKAVDRAVDLFGRLTILVNVAAAVTPPGRAEDLSLADWEDALRVNLTGAFLTAKYAAPEMRKAGGGSIVNIASQLGQIGVPLRAPYSTSKAALIQLTKCLAVDYAIDNIRANTISPGSIDTDRSTRNYGSRENARRLRGPMHLLGRTGSVEEVAAAALFLASEQASFVTGADLLVDGGYLAFKGQMPAPATDRPA